MSNMLIMGNEAIGLGAINAGVSVVCGYPGTPSSEILETVAKNNLDKSIYVEWSVNEKAAMEIAAGAAISGVRTLVTMKQVGLNVASDPLMSLAYVGIKGGMVVVVADDPGPISSQTEQDTRHFGIFSKLPVFDPVSPKEAYDMVVEAFEYSEKYKTPVILRPTTRVCHACSTIDVVDVKKEKNKPDFEKSSKWVIFPKLSYNNHIMMEKRNIEIGKDFSTYIRNTISGNGKKGVATGGVSYRYTFEASKNISSDFKLLKVATPTPFIDDLAKEFLQGLDEVLVVEELDPVIEKQLLILCARENIKVTIKGKLSGHIKNAGENTTEEIYAALCDFLGQEAKEIDIFKKPDLPIRPPILCAGCPHRGAFYSVKIANKGKKTAFCGDIGCYTLGNAAPLNMVDTCLCMGAGITQAQGIKRADNSINAFAFIGDSTFFHTGIAGVANAVYNQADITVIVLDNQTTAMTGHQPHPGMGKTMMGESVKKIDIEKVLEGIGVECIYKANPHEIYESSEIVKKARDFKGVSAVIFEAPCIALFKPKNKSVVDKNKCTGCKKCVKDLGCPALMIKENKVEIDDSLCYGCTQCVRVCPFDAIGGQK